MSVNKQVEIACLKGSPIALEVYGEPVQLESVYTTALKKARSLNHDFSRKATIDGVITDTAEYHYRAWKSWPASWASRSTAA